MHIADDPEGVRRVQSASSATHGTSGLVTLGAVFLAVTGAEALYADLGHFGRKPIQTGVALFRAAGARAAMGAVPDDRARHCGHGDREPSGDHRRLLAHQPSRAIGCCHASRSGARRRRKQARSTFRIRGLLLVGTILLVVLFQSSNGLASAYGVAVAGTMLVDGLMAFIVVWRVWKWALWGALALMAPFMLVDFAFFGSNLLKVPQGGWVPILIGASLLTLMLTWHLGARILAAKTRRLETPLNLLLKSLVKNKPPACPAPLCSSRPRRRARQRRSCTASSTTRCCTKAM